MALVTHGAQVAGHGDLLSDNKGRVYKSAVDLEAAFYVALPHNHPIVPFIPGFYGLMRREGQKVDTIILEDLLYGVEHASILDVKLGRITVLPDMPEEKRLLSAAKDKMSTTTQLGLRITGFRSWRTSSSSFLKREKEWGKKLPLKAVPDGFRMFFDDGNSLRTEVLDMVIVRLEELEKVIMAELKGYKFVSSSILVIYGMRAGKLHVDVRMIDFAHTLPPADQRVSVEEVDYLYGFRNLLTTLKLIRASPDQRCVSDAVDSSTAS
jgi:hypothetical protein